MRTRDQLAHPRRLRPSPSMGGELRGSPRSARWRRLPTGSGSSSSPVPITWQCRPGCPRRAVLRTALSTFSYLASITERIRFLPYVLVLPFYHPLDLAKRYGTLDALSGGRLTLGLGVGNLREEFDLLGVPFDDRGPHADDAMRALRAALGKKHHLLRRPLLLLRQPRDLAARRAGARPDVGRRALGSGVRHHAVALADGWRPRRCGSTVRARRPSATCLLASSCPTASTCCSSAMAPSTRSATRAACTRRSIGPSFAGATVMSLVVRHASLDHYLDQLAAYARDRWPPGRALGLSVVR